MCTVTQYELAWELYQAKLDVIKIGEKVGRDRATVYRWISSIKKLGIREFVRRKKESKRRRQSRTINTQVKNNIKQIRKKTGWCGQKIQKELKEKHGIRVSLMSIYRILKEDFKVGSAWRVYKDRGEAPKATAPRQVVQHDTVNFGGIYAYTSIDIFSKEPTVIMALDLTSNTGVKVLKIQQAYYGFVELDQSDEGPEFKGSFPISCNKHRYARPYKKNDQAYIENLNRSLRKECLGWGKYHPNQLEEVQARVDVWLEHWLNERWHMGLPDMQTPAEFNRMWCAEHNQIYEPVAFAL